MESGSDDAYSNYTDYLDEDEYQAKADEENDFFSGTIPNIQPTVFVEGESYRELHGIWDKYEYPDCQLYVEDSVINAHRTILCAASKVMSNNFGGAGTEKTTFIEFDYTKKSVSLLVTKLYSDALSFRYKRTSKLTSFFDDATHDELVDAMKLFDEYGVTFYTFKNLIEYDDSNIPYPEYLWTYLATIMNFSEAVDYVRKFPDQIDFIREESRYRGKTSYHHSNDAFLIEHGAYNRVDWSRILKTNPFDNIGMKKMKVKTIKSILNGDRFDIILSSLRYEIPRGEMIATHQKDTINLLHSYYLEKCIKDNYYVPYLQEVFAYCLANQLEIVEMILVSNLTPVTKKLLASSKLMDLYEDIHNNNKIALETYFSNPENYSLLKIVSRGAGPYNYQGFKVFVKTENNHYAIATQRSLLQAFGTIWEIYDKYTE